MKSDFLSLPDAVKELASARDRLTSHYNHENLSFTFDGKLVGDIGEAVASTYFEVEIDGRNRLGIDGLTPDKKTVQVKASSVFGGAAFRPCPRESWADFFLFFHLDFENSRAEVVYNGPEQLVRKKLGDLSGQRIVSVATLRELNAQAEDSRLPMRRTAPSSRAV